MGSLNPPPSDLLKYYDGDLQDFYHEVLNKELNVQTRRNVLKIKQALKEVVDAYKQENVNSPSIRFDTSAKRCAYVLKHSACFTSAVAKHFLRVIRRNSSLLQKCLDNGELNLCCLGGGPASDAVAVTKVLGALYRPHWIRTRRSLKVRVTVVDLNGDWDVTAGHVLDTLESGCDAEGVNLGLRFCQADLSQPMAAEVKEILRNADVLTMVYFLSAVNRGKDTDESHRMVQEILGCMKSGAFVFFLDSAREINYNQMSEAAAILGNLEQIYGPRLEEFHTLSLNSIRKFLDLYKKEFGRWLCMTNCFVSSSAWTKLDDVLWIKQLPRSQMDNQKVLELLRHKTAQKASDLTRKMMAFRAQVENLLATELDDSLNESLHDDCDEQDDPFDILPNGYFQCIPNYFFPTKTKKKRIFTGLPLSI